jgi:flagellar hook-associated protein 2
VADFGYGGIGSGLDISSIVNQLVAADRKPADNALNLQQSKTKMQLSSLGTVTSAFDKLKTALTALKATTAFDTRTVSATGKAGPNNADDVLTASVALYDLGTSKAAAANGTHKVEVKNLASAHKLIADTSVPKTDTFGAGTLTLTVGVGDKAKTMNVQVEEGDTLTTVRNKIDAAGRKEGVQATLISSGDNQYLSIAQEKTGAASAIKLEYAGSDPKLGALVGSLKENSPAKDAVLTIDGVEVVSASNTVTDAVPGLTLNLKVPGLSTVTISTDTTAATKVMQEFVTAYNAAIAAINTETKYDAKTKEAAALTGDAQMRGAIAQLRSTMSGVLKDLAGDQLDAKALGLQTRGYPNADGTLVLDSTKFAAALAAQPEKIRQAVTGDTGGAGRLYSLVDGYVSTTVGKEGAFVARTKGLNTTLDNIDKRRKDLDARMVGVEARYKKQFVALDSLMGKLQQSNTALQQQLAQLNR